MVSASHQYEEELNSFVQISQNVIQMFSTSEWSLFQITYEDLCTKVAMRYLKSIPLNGIFDCKIKLFFGRQEKNILTQGIINDITKQDTSLLDCKHKHMIKSGAPPYKVGVLHCLLPIEFHGFTSRIDF